VKIGLKSHFWFLPRGGSLVNIGIAAKYAKTAGQ